MAKAAENKAPDPSSTVRFWCSLLMDLGAWVLVVSFLLWKRDMCAGFLVVASWCRGHCRRWNLFSLLCLGLDVVFSSSVKAGGETCTGVCRRGCGSRSVSLLSVGEGDEEELPVVLAGHHISGVLVRKDLSLKTSRLQEFRPQIPRSRRLREGV